MSHQQGLNRGTQLESAITTDTKEGSQSIETAQLSRPHPTETRELQVFEAKQSLQVFVEQDFQTLPLNTGAKMAAKRYLTNLCTQSPADIDQGIAVVRTVAAIVSDYSFESNAGDRSLSPDIKANSSILSGTALIKVAEDLNLHPKEVRQIASLSEHQERNVSRVGGFVKQLAAMRTANDKEVVFREMSPEKRVDVFEEALALTQQVRDCERTVDQKFSLVQVEKLLELIGSVEEVGDIIEALVNTRLSETRYADSVQFGRSANFVYSMILNHFVEFLEKHPDYEPDINEFLSDADHSRYSAVLKGFDCDGWPEDDGFVQDDINEEEQ